MNRKDLTGQKFSHLTVIEMLYGYRANEKQRKRTFARCVCDCGNEKVIEVTHLTRPNVSCGCMSKYYRQTNNRTNEIGQTFNFLTILDIDYSVKPSIAICECQCGNIVRVSKADVISGHTQSCGCYHKKQTSKHNYKDVTGYISDYGVKILRPAYKKRGVWYWYCECPICHKEFVSLPAKVKSNHTTSCGCRRQSKNEEDIDKYLKLLKVNYKKQVRFPECKYHYTLPFDFGVCDNQGNLLFLLEYDGEQHYRSVECFGGDKNFELTKIRDKIKDKYCQDNNIKLIRVKYDKTFKEIKTIINNTIENP